MARLARLGHMATNRMCAAVIWCVCNQRTAMAVLGAVFAAAVLAGSLCAPKQAHAVPLIPIALGALGGLGGKLLVDQASDTVEAGIKGFIDMCNAAAADLVKTNTSNTILTAHVKDMFPGGPFDTVSHIHNVAVVPVANIVLIIFLVIGLWKVFMRGNTGEYGVDTWQLILVFFAYGVAKLLIDNSFDLLLALASLGQGLTSGIIETGTAATDMQTTAVGDDVNDFGVLLFLALMSVLNLLGMAIVCGLMQAVIIVRAIKIYAYTAFAPIPLAFMASDGGRQMTANFLKKYAAVILSGAVLALLFVMYATVATNFSPNIPTIDSVESAGQWAIESLFGLVVYLAFAWAMFKSGQWSNDIMGV